MASRPLGLSASRPRSSLWGRAAGTAGGLLCAHSPRGNQASNADAPRVPAASLLSHTTIYDHFSAAEARLKRMPKSTDGGLRFGTKQEQD